MIRHTVVFRLNQQKDSLDEKDFFKALQELVSIAGVHNLECSRQTNNNNDYHTPLLIL